MNLPTDFRGSRQAAEALLEAIDPARYGATRNHLDGAVTRLSPYIRHGVLTLAEVRDRVLARGGGGKLIQELGWRDYWQRLWRQWGDGIWLDREPLKTGHPPEAYGPDLPADLSAAATGLACIDAFATDLMVTGWLHNHARMWLAAYVVHWRRVRWQAGARWFLQHLLDADPASNNLSWQWLASSFSHKPYIFNRANLERFGGGRYCAACPAASRGGAAAPGGCPFDASYEWLQARLFRSPEPGEQALPPGGLASVMQLTVRGVSGGKIIGEWPLQVRAEVWREVWLAPQRMDRGQMLQPSLLTARTVDILKEFNPPIAADQDLSGFELAQAVQAGKPISRKDLVERSLVRKGQFVDAVANEGGLNIRMRAQAMEAGPAGAVIRVRNLDSQKVFFAQVINENQVQVRF